MSSITATFGAYVITKAKDAKITVTKDGEVCSNAKQAIREIAEEAGFEVDPAWNTQTAGAKLIKFLLTDLAAEDLLEYDPCDLDGDGKVTFDEKIQYGLKQASEKAGLIMGEAKEIGKAFCDKASAKTKVVAAAVQAKVQGLKDSTIFQQKNNELFYIESLMDWLKEVCIIETDCHFRI